MDTLTFIAVIVIAIIAVIPGILLITFNGIKKKEEKEIENGDCTPYKVTRPKEREPVELEKMLNSQYENGYRLHEIYGDIFIFKYTK